MPLRSSKLFVPTPHPRARCFGIALGDIESDFDKIALGLPGTSGASTRQVSDPRCENAVEIFIVDDTTHIGVLSVENR